MAFEMLHRANSYLLIIWIWLLKTHQGQCQNELFANSDFEEPFENGDNWFCVSCDLIHYNIDAFNGNYCAKVTNRYQDWSGIRQQVTLHPNTYYYFSVHVKLDSMLPGSMWHNVDILMQIQYQNDTSDYLWAGRIPHLRLDQGWQRISGDFRTGDIVMKEVVYFRAQINVNLDSEEKVDYFVDDASLQAFSLNSKWKEDAYERIEQIRKSSATVHINISDKFDPASLKMEIIQRNKSFPFGTAVVNSQISGDSDYNKRYQQTFYENFNWAVLENDLKWTHMEHERGNITYPDKCIERLNANGVPIRGHTVFWGKQENVPDWLKQLSQDEIEADIQRRMEYLLPRYSDQLAHWDVNNEQLHGTWFEETLSNPWLLHNMFSDTRSKDENTVLFLNDYQIISNNGYTQALINSALDVNSTTGNVGGIGGQSHFNGYPDVAAVTKRLDILSTGGFPVWITELDVCYITDAHLRAAAYDDIITLLYSFDIVDGILLWGFSDNHGPREYCSLFDGDNFQPNAAGKRWQEMMFERWMTKENFYPVESEETFYFTGFHGDYIVQIFVNEEVVHLQQFEISKGAGSTVIDIII